MRGPAALAALALLTAALSGCAEPPEVPEDALVVRQPDLDGLTLSAWVEQRDGITYLRAVTTNDSERTYETKEDCGYLWQSVVTDENGTAHTYKRPVEVVCDWAYDFLFPAGHKEFLHSWDGTFWLGDGADAEGSPAPAGNYTWTLRFLLRDGSDHETFEPVPGRFMEAQVAFVMPASP